MSLDPKRIYELDESPDKVVQPEDVFEFERRLTPPPNATYKNEKRTGKLFQIVDLIQGEEVTPTAIVKPVILTAPFTGRIAIVSTQTLGGTVQFGVRINGTLVNNTGHTAGTTIVNRVAGGNAAFTLSDTIEIQMASPSSGVRNLRWNIVMERVIAKLY
jgi:hypothetical protein